MPAVIPLRLALFYAAVFFLFGIQLPFWPVWLVARGLSATEIGTILAVGQWVRVATNPLAGIAADRSGDKRRIMLILSLGAIAGFALFLPVHGFGNLLVLNVATGACLSALLPLGDNFALAAAYAGRLDYGRVRIWGSLGFIAATLLTGRVLAASGVDVVLYLLIGASVFIGAACFALPSSANPSARPVGGGWRALATPRFLIFLAAAALIQGSHGVYYGFGTLYWQSLGLSDATIAALWAEGVLAEILLFFWGAPLVHRFSPLGLLALGGGAGFIRWTVTPFIAAPPLLALAQLLHALTFGAAHLGAMHYLARTIPMGRAATGQALYAATVGGIGAGFLLLLAGALYSAAGGMAYLAMAASAAVGGAAALLLSATKS